MGTPIQTTGQSHRLSKIMMLLVSIGGLVTSSPTTSDGPDDATVFQHGNILSPLLKALSEQEGPWRDISPRTRPESRYVRYMKRLYKMSSKHERNSDGTHLYNTVRLITPRDECLEQSRGVFIQDLSYNLDRVRAKEQLLKSVLLYSFNQDQAISITSLCYLDMKEQEHSDQCQLCPSAHHTVSFLVRTDRRSRRKWVEVDVTAFLHPLIKCHKKDIHLLTNLTCVEDGGAKGEERRHPVELTLRSPSLLLYLNDTSELAHQRWPATTRSGQRSALGMNTFESQMEFNSEQRTGRKKRRKREATKPRPANHLPDLLSSSDFPTSDCALYDFRVSFSQLKLDHWIIIPHKYNPRYCKGTCPSAMGFIGSPVHTMVQNIIFQKLDSSVPRPSCVPSAYNALSVLTIENDGSIAYKEYEEMIATRCTCR